MSTELTIKEDQTGFDAKQVAALHQLGMKDAQPADLAVFFHQCQRTGLDPFARQIYMIERWTKDGPKQTIQTGIDGFRLIARRATDQRGGTLSISQPYFAGRDGVWRDFWPFEEPPIAAKVMVKRDGGEFPAVAMFREYAGTTKNGQLTRMWADKPAVMIGKCAEALALRKAFPQDLSSLYTSDEMARADQAPDPAGRSEAVATYRATQDAVASLTDEEVLACTDAALLRQAWKTASPEQRDLIEARGNQLASEAAQRAAENSQDPEVVEAEIVTDPARDPNSPYEQAEVGA